MAVSYLIAPHKFVPKTARAVDFWNNFQTREWGPLAFPFKWLHIVATVPQNVTIEWDVAHIVYERMQLDLFICEKHMNVLAEAVITHKINKRFIFDRNFVVAVGLVAGAPAKLHWAKWWNNNNGSW